jgi:CBS domain containing-hemolysin-like protein
MLITTSESQGIIGRKEGVMMRELVDFGKVLVREVMVPRVDMVMFQKDRPVSELIELIRTTGHSRIPVFGRSQDDVLGFIDGRDVFLNPGKPVMEMINRVYYVPETKTVESLLSEFRHQKKTTAIVVDEYGGTAGLVALEDAVEAIVGEIHDEYDKPEAAVREFGENSYLLSGRVSVADWAEMFDIDVEDRRPATLGGLVIMLLGHLPKEGEQAGFANVRFTITRVRAHCIEEVLVEITEPAAPAGEPQ